MPLPEHVWGSTGVVTPAPLPAAAPCPALPAEVPADAVGAVATVPAALDPAAPLDGAAVDPAVAEPAAPLLGLVAVPVDPPAGGFAELAPAVALEPAAPGVAGAVAADPLDPVAPVCVSGGALEQAARHSESNAEGTSMRRAKVRSLGLIDILLSSRVRHRNTDESRIGGRTLGRARRKTFSIVAP
jgi:hypothetical protein